MKRENSGNRSQRPKTSFKSSGRPSSTNRRSSSEGTRSYKKPDNAKDSRFEKKSYKSSGSEGGRDSERKPYPNKGNDYRQSGRKSESGGSFGKDTGRKPYAGRNQEGKSFERKPGSKSTFTKNTSRKPFSADSETGKSYGKRTSRDFKKETSGRPFSKDAETRNFDKGNRRASTNKEKKGYGQSDSFAERKNLKSRSDGNESRDNITHANRIGKNEEFPVRSSRRRSDFTESTPGKGKFTKKSELKGFKPKIGMASNEDFRFLRPGSKGKKVDLGGNEEFVSASKSQAKERATEAALKTGESIRLNRFISNAGVCSRREADDLIKAGLVSINSEVVTELGTKVKAGDVVRFNGEKLSVEAKVYIVLNKPKDAITTADDPEGRNTVMDIFDGQLKERIFPIGRLDRNTTGVLLLTNDGELATRLMHPKYEIRKVYKATLDKNLKPVDLWALSNGVELEDGYIKPDAIATADAKNKNVVGIEIHSGKNRIIHRMFEHLGYSVEKLDRVLYAGMEKGTLKRGAWRELNEKELKNLKKSVHLK